MSKIYVITDRKTGEPARFVRAKTLAGAIRAFANENFIAEAATAEDIVSASAAGDFSVLDALEDAADPGPVPARAAA